MALKKVFALLVVLLACFWATLGAHDAVRLRPLSRSVPTRAACLLRSCQRLKVARAALRLEPVRGTERRRHVGNVF